jgi:hypothetical protein
VIDETSMMWFQLRERRGSIHKRSKFLKDATSRRKTFAAAMQQFEEQMTAAKVVTPATGPVNLYYGLAQAGMAIAAAHAPGQWSFSSHGLQLCDTSPELADICVKPEGNGAFQVVASATGSSGIGGPVSIGGLWASLPDLCEQAPLPGADSPAALYVAPDLRSPMTIAGSGIAMTTFYHEPPAAKVHMKAEMPDPSRRQLWLHDLAERYPAFHGWKADPLWEEYERGGEPEFAIRIWLPGPVTKEPLPATEMGIILDKLAPEYLYRDDRYLRPSLEGGGKAAPSPLMTWWLLLYSFSMLARYQPRKWTDLLNLDKPGCATQLQYALEVALSAIPHLVLEALDGKPRLLSKPLLL